VPGTDAIVLAGQIPTVVATANQTIAPSPKTGILIGLAPTLTQTGIQPDPYPLGSGGGPLQYFPSQAEIRDQVRRERAAQWVREEQAKTRRLMAPKPQKPKAPPLVIPRPEFKVEPPKAPTKPQKPAKLDKRAIAQRVKAAKLARKKRRQEDAIARALRLLIE